MKGDQSEDLRRRHALSRQESCSCIVDDEALDHHRRAAHDGRIDLCEADAHDLPEADEIVVGTVDLHEPEEHEAKGQEEGDDGADDGNLDRAEDALDERVTHLVEHVEHRCEEVRRIRVR